jgi:hypothetical protein
MESKLNKMKKISTFLIIVTGSFITFFSCINLDVEKEILADAFIASKIINGDTIYAIGGYVSSNTAMKSVTIKSPNGNFSAELKKTNYYGGYYERPLNDEDFSKIKPSKGNYKFEITFDDDTKSDTTDYVTSDILEPIEIKEIKTDDINNSVLVDWVKNKNADYYTISIYRNDSIVYYSNQIDPGYSSVEIFAHTNSWETNINPNPGDSLQIIVSGVLRESGNSLYPEFQSLSLSSKVDVIWPE